MTLDLRARTKLKHIILKDHFAVVNQSWLPTMCVHTTSQMFAEDIISYNQIIENLMTCIVWLN